MIKRLLIAASPYWNIHLEGVGGSIAYGVAPSISELDARLYADAMNVTKRRRCVWAGDDPLMQAYHDREWGVPERDPRALWEVLTLEGFQAGLSWAVVLRKREALREAFARVNQRSVRRRGERQRRGDHEAVRR
jgi:hypothetical protein